MTNRHCNLLKRPHIKKLARRMGTSSIIYLPKAWLGDTVIATPIDGYPGHGCQLLDAETIQKTVKPNGNGAAIYVKKRWAGKTILAINIGRRA